MKITLNYFKYGKRKRERERVKSSNLKKKGFTLIELLIVIAIIGLLSSVVLASLNSARKKARDARRMSDLNEIRKALEFYFDANGYYPQSGGCGWDCNGYSFSTDASWDALQSDLSPYIPKLPKDPINNAAGPWSQGNLSYAYGNVGKTTYLPQYDLTTQLEDTSNPQRCGVKIWRWYFNDQVWCNTTNDSSPYSRQIYEASID